MKSHYSRNLQAAFGLSLVILLISSIASYVSIRSLLESTRVVNRTYVVIKNLDEAILHMVNAETGQRGYLLTSDSSFLQPYNGSYEEVVKSLDRVKSQMMDDQEEKAKVDELLRVIKERYHTLQSIIDEKHNHGKLSLTELRSGKLYMDSARSLVNDLQQIENDQLRKRTETMRTFSVYTPTIIVIAALIALIITILFYIRLNKDHRQRVLLQNELLSKDQDISHRITIIQSLAEKISNGDYSIRIDQEQQDGLGVLSLSLDKMARSLESSFNLLSDKEWLQAGSNGLNAEMVGEKHMPELTQSIIAYLANYTDSQLGALYTTVDERLKLEAGFALPSSGRTEYLNIGEGIMGQAVLSGKEISLDNIPANDFYISFAAGEIKPQYLFAFPVRFEKGIIAGIELLSVHPYSERSLTFLRSVAENIGIAINVAQSRSRLEELLAETQAQTEELQAQHTEMEVLNSELEHHSEKLQASEEELKVQQEELKQANQELEERASLLEEKNEIISQRNYEIQRKAEELIVSTKYKSEFLANMSHELRTPLNSILLLSRLMSENADKNLNEEQIEYANVILSSGNGLLELINEVLDLSKIEAGKMNLEYLWVDLADIIAENRALFAPLAKEKNLKFIVEVDPEAPLSIETDKMRLQQILKNLLSNAIKFTDKGSITLQIKVDEQQKSHLRFIVSDTGLGIPTDKQGLIFEAFQQADGSTKRKYGGTGLGLSISRELVKLLGGEIGLTSKVNEGSQFFVSIPYTQIHRVTEYEEISDQPDKRAYLTDGEEHKDPDMEKPRYVVPIIPASVNDDRDLIVEGDKVILIIEDDTPFAKALMQFTHKKGYKGIVAVRGDEGLELANHYLPTAILLDIQLPIKDGWEVMEELKRNHKTRHIPVHIMSSMEAKKESLLKGAVDFINKPFALEQMSEVFRKLEDALKQYPKKVLIVEENPQHARALAYFLENSDIYTEIKSTINDGMAALKKDEVDCVIIDTGLPDSNAYETLEAVKKNPGWENLPIIIFTGKSISKSEEQRIKQYADSIVVKTAHSYQRILDEITLFLHIVEENGVKKDKHSGSKKMLDLNEVLSGKTVLVADDDVRNIFSLTKALERHNMNVLSAIDGKEALGILKLNPQVDIVLMDMMMPEMDGYEAIRNIKSLSEFKKLPILAVTAKAMQGDREKCIRAGASDYISKPVDIDQLVSLLRVWLYDKSI